MAKSFIFVCRKANTSYGEAVLHARSALHCGKAATSLKTRERFHSSIARGSSRNFSIPI